MSLLLINILISSRRSQHMILNLPVKKFARIKTQKEAHTRYELRAGALNGKSKIYFLYIISHFYTSHLIFFS